MPGPDPENFRLGDPADNTGFEAVRRGFQAVAEIRDNGAETIHTTLGEYAIQQPPGKRWRFTSPEQWQAAQDPPGARPVYRQDWATAEELRTRTCEGVFEPGQMALLDEALVREQRVTNAGTKLAIATEDELRQIIDDYRVPTGHWPPTNLHDLYGYIRPGGPETENVSLHAVNNELWLATAQTMLANVYYETADGSTYRLRETEKRYFDNQGNLGEPVQLSMRSSLGEIGRLVYGVPEEPPITARRCLKEEISAYDEDVVQIVSTGSLLRQKRQSHHTFAPLKTEDHTHYFNAWLDPEKVQRNGYISIENDGDNKPRVRIKLGWFKVTAA